MFDTDFSYASATPLPGNFSVDTAIGLLHDFETIIKLSPDCRGCKPIAPPKNGQSKTNGGANGKEMSYYEVEDELPFIPKRLWSGGVKYNAEFLRVQDGCDIIVHAPGGFTSTNHWRLLRETAPISTLNNVDTDGRPSTIPEEERNAALSRSETKDSRHADTQSGGLYVQIISDASCPRLYAGYVKGFLKNSHAQQQHAFVDRLRASGAKSRPQNSRRPTLGRRRSTDF